MSSSFFNVVFIILGMLYSAAIQTLFLHVQLSLLLPALWTKAGFSVSRQSLCYQKRKRMVEKSTAIVNDIVSRWGIMGEGIQHTPNNTTHFSKLMRKSPLSPGKANLLLWKVNFLYISCCLTLDIWSASGFCLVLFTMMFRDHDPSVIHIKL